MKYENKNSPCLCHRKCLEKTKENMYPDVEALRFTCKMDIYLMLRIFFPLAGSAWYNYENANDCANFCPDLQVSAVSRSLLMSVIVGANFRLAISYMYANYVILC